MPVLHKFWTAKSNRLAPVLLDLEQQIQVSNHATLLLETKGTLFKLLQKDIQRTTFMTLNITVT